MFRHRHRRPSPFADFINWTDYRWDPSPRPGASADRRGPWGAHRPRRYNLIQVLFAGLAVVAGLKLMSTLRNGRNRSWLERAVLAALLLSVASYVSKRARQRSW